MNMDKMKEIFADEAFVKSLFELESAGEVQAALKEKGVELTEEQILGIRDLLGKVESGELSEELLEQVSGGSVLGTIGLALIGAACVAAFAIATDDLIYECTGRHW